MKLPFLVIDHLTLSKNNTVLIRDISLSFAPGEIHVLLGINGSGKSSLAYTLMGCEGYVPSSGMILMDGKDIKQASITERARLGITLAWQEPVRFEGLPIGKYIGLGIRENSREKVVAALEAVSLSAKAYGYRSNDHSLSGGERKRVELAAVYAMQPRLAILDEPDSGIDALSIMEIAGLIQKMAEQGSAVLLITHRPELVAVADVAHLMCLGTIVFSGDPKDVNEYYQSRCHSHLDVLGEQPWMQAAQVEKDLNSQEI